MKLNKIGILVLTVLVGALMVPVTAQAQEGVNGRLKHQHMRIRQGVRSGELTRREARTVRRDDRAIHLRERADRLTAHGHLTARERRNLQRQLNRNSKRIYRLKHNGTVRP